MMHAATSATRQSVQQRHYGALTSVRKGRKIVDREPGMAAEPLPAGADEEAVLVARLRRGDDGAYEELVRRFGGRMLATARRVLNNEEDARDAVQEAFLCAFKALDRFSGESKVSTWLHRIVVNASLMKLRGKRRKPEQSIEDLLPSFDENGTLVDIPDEGAVAVDVQVEREQSRLIVRKCIDQLPESYRTILMLRDIEELDTDEVAAMLDITPTAVRVRLHRARQALRTLIERAFGS